MSPAPYPPDTRAKGWRFEVDLERVRQSDTWALATADIRPWLLMIWCTAWEQTPCGSLPADDQLIAARIGIAPKALAKHRAVLMRGWWLADDGRLYHPTITALVLAMANRKDAERQRKAEYRARMSHGTDKGLTPDGRGSPPDATLPEPEPEPVLETKTKTARKRASPAAHVSVDDLVAQGVEKQHAQDWLAARKVKSLPLTLTALEQTKDEATKAGLSLPSAIKTAAGNGWAGFKASWLTSDSRDGSAVAVDPFSGAH